MNTMRPWVRVLPLIACFAGIALAGAAGAAGADEAPPLIGSSAPVSIGIELQPGLYRAQIQAREAATVTLFCPLKPGVIGLIGLTEKTQVSYDARARLLSVTLPPGKYTLTVRPLE